jgi:hypothetical protein
MYGLKIGDVVYLEQECRRHMLKTSKVFDVQSVDFCHAPLAAPSAASYVVHVRLSCYSRTRI